MICVRCTKNNAPAGIYLCAFCKDRPFFKKQKVNASVIEAFDKLPRKKQSEILLLVHQRLMSLINIARLCDFKLNELLTDYVMIANLKSEEIKRDIAMKPVEIVRESYFGRTNYNQYISPKKEYQP